MRKDGDVISLLKNQIDHPVLWTACVGALKNKGITRYIETGPGKVLTGLGKRIDREGKFLSAGSVDSLKKLEAILKEEV